MWTIASVILGRLIPKKRGHWVFGGRQYGGNTAPVFEAAASKGLKATWVTTRSTILESGRPAVVSARSWAGLWAVVRAEGVVLTHSLGDFSPLKFSSPKTRIINLWHGMPIKRISTADPDFHTRSYAKSNLKEMARFECMVATSDAMAALFSKTFGLPDERVHRTGQPRTDILMSPPTQALESRYSPPLPEHSFKILYCPTWRDGNPVKLFPFSDRDWARLDEALEALGAILFVRTHPNDPGKLKTRHARIVPMQGDIAPEVTNELGHFHCLITDYSSVYYDFLMLDRPTIFLPYDLDEYAQRPGFYIPFEEIAPGPYPASQDEFVEQLDRACRTPEVLMQKQRLVRDLIYDYVDDGATQRVLSLLAGSSGE